MTPSSTRSVAAQEAALERIAVLCRTLAADMPISALLLVDRDLRLKLAAGSGWARGGFDPAAIVGLHVREVFPAELHEEVFLHYAAVLQGETRRFVVSHHRTFRTTVVPVYGNDGEVAGCLSIAWDENAELRAAREAGIELARRLAQQSAVARLGELALRRPPLPELMEDACEAVREGLGVDTVYVLEQAVHRGLMRVRAGCGWPEGFVGSEFEVRSFADADGRRLYAEGPVVIDDLPNDPSWRARPLREHGIVSSATVLLGPRRAPAGLLGAHTTTRRRFSDRDLDFLTAVAHVLNGAIQGRRVEEQIRHDCGRSGRACAPCCARRT